MKLKSVPTVPAIGVEKTAGAPRFLIYSHDTFGLGHFRRCLKIAQAFASTYPQSSILIVSGQPQAERYRLPEGTDFIKLPAVMKVGENRYQPRSLGSSFEKVFELRQNLILEAVRSFAPHIFLVDHSPLGMKGEITRTLVELRTQADSAALVLGLRDILDEPEKVCKAWTAEGVYPILDEVYDRIFIYGTPEFFDPVSSYRFGQAAKDKTSFTGFIADSARLSASANVANGDTRKILLTIGGGEDGAEIVATYIEMLLAYGERLAVETTAVLGPFMPENKRKAFTVQAQDLSLSFEEFVPELSTRLAEADLVISMGGYNTTVEILGAARRALIIPRIYPRREQLLRARRLFEMGLVDYVSPEELSPARLFRTVMSALNRSKSPLADARAKNLLPLDGAIKLAELCRPLLAQKGVLK